MRLKGGSIWAGYLTPYEKLVYAINIGQHYLMENTTLGIPALFQSEGTSNHRNFNVHFTPIQYRSPRIHRQWDNLSLTNRPRRVL